MCGRYVAPDTASIERAGHIGRTNSNPLRRRVNVLPTTDVPIILRAADADELKLTEARWGLIPHWWSKPKSPTSTINTRSEEAAASPRGGTPTGRRAALFPRWAGTSGSRWKVAMRPLVSSAPTSSRTTCVWTVRACMLRRAHVLWTSAGGEQKLSCAILTRAPSESAARIHDRMPVILPDAAHHEWLNPELTNAGKVGEIIRLTAMNDVNYHPVTTRLNSAKTDDEDLIKSIMEKS